MKKILSVLCTLCLLAASFVLPSVTAVAQDASFAGTVYYVDAENGLDTNDGKSENTAWQNVTTLQRRSFKPGDAILLKRGCVWTDSFIWIKSSGEENKPITVSCYGDSNLQLPTVMNGERPIADTTSYKACVYLANVDYVVIDSLICVVKSTGTDSMYGVRILARNGYRTYGCAVRNCVISGSPDVSWTSTDQEKLAGITVAHESYYGYIGSVDIENNVITDCKANGISIDGGYGGCNADGSENAKSATDVYIADNYLENIGKDGILTNNCNQPLVEYNTSNKAHSYAKTTWHVAMWPFASYKALFQYNEAYNTQTTYDGSGFDCDYQCYYTTMQYNYSHHNQGGFMLICTEPKTWDDKTAFNVGVTVRYNISENDEGKTFCLTCHITDTKIYNNTIFNESGTAVDFIYVYSRDGKAYPINTQFKNNIFYVNSGKIQWFKSTGTVFENNIVYGAASAQFPKNDEDESGDDKITASGNIYADPCLMRPGTAGVGRERCVAYKLRSDSPAFGAGKLIADNGGKDFFGLAVSDSEAPNIGADNCPLLKGDVNFDGEVNAKDVLMLRRYIAGFELQLDDRADVLKDTKLNAKDVLMLRKYIAGVINFSD